MTDRNNTPVEHSIAEPWYTSFALSLLAVAIGFSTPLIHLLCFSHKNLAVIWTTSDNYVMSIFVFFAPVLLAMTYFVLAYTRNSILPCIVLISTLALSQSFLRHLNKLDGFNRPMPSPITIETGVAILMLLSIYAAALLNRNAMKAKLGG